MKIKYLYKHFKNKFTSKFMYKKWLEDNVIHPTNNDMYKKIFHS